MIIIDTLEQYDVSEGRLYSFQGLVRAVKTAHDRNPIKGLSIRCMLPAEMTDSVKLQLPGPQANSGSDHTSFLCRGVPAFRLQSSYSEYRQYTWHTNRDTFDKIVFDDLKNNATMAAMLAYAASEDPERTNREQALLLGPTGAARSWPSCGTAKRTYK